jgi:L-lysine exporter family protein LysE/ArgO
LAALLFFVYGNLSFRDAIRTEESLNLSAKNSDIKVTSLKRAIAIVLAFPNSHVYLDTILLMGRIDALYDETTKYYFALGAISASFIWFFALA